MWNIAATVRIRVVRIRDNEMALHLAPASHAAQSSASAMMRAAVTPRLRNTWSQPFECELTLVSVIPLAYLSPVGRSVSFSQPLPVAQGTLLLQA